MLIRAACVIASIGALTACEKRHPTPAPTPSAAPAASSAARLASSAPKLGVSSARSAEKDEPPIARRDAGASPASELQDIGPAGPATASARGVVMVTKDDQIVLAAFSKKNALEPVTNPADAFRAVARGPAVAGDFAYWTAGGRLVRSRIEGGTRESLADDARDGTRVASSIIGAGKTAHAVAAYVARAGDSTTARLWIERVGTWTLTPEGAAATSVALTASDSAAVVLSLEGRTGMTPVHARVADFTSGTPMLKDDVVVWVAGPAQPVTEIAAAESSGSVWGFVPLERDITRFGIAQIELGAEPRMGSPVIWRAYPNGIDPAPIAAGAACGGAIVLYATPSDAKPGSPQELHLAMLGASGLGASEIVARARAFANVSLAAVATGVLVVYVADHRTWATVIRCPGRK